MSARGKMRAWGTLIGLFGVGLLVDYWLRKRGYLEGPADPGTPFVVCLAVLLGILCQYAGEIAHLRERVRRLEEQSGMPPADPPQVY